MTSCLKGTITYTSKKRNKELEGEINQNIDKYLKVDN